MKLRVAQIVSICGVLALGTLGCKKVGKDNSRVIASVGSEKITESYFNNIIRTYLGDEDKANNLLNNPEMREERNQILANLINQKALFQFIKAQGIDKDPQAQLQIASAEADAYFQIMSNRLMSNTEPTEEQLKAVYNDYASRAKVNKNTNIPSYQQVRSQLPNIWRHEQRQIAQESILNQINQKYPVILAEDYQIIQNKTN